MVDKEVLSRKLSQLQQYVAELRAAQDITWSVYQADIRAKAFVERYLHLAIESLIDIANHVISFQGWREPEGYRDVFTVLHENSIISAQDLPIYQRMASFRNMLVHRYEKIDDATVFGLFKNRLDDFDRFFKLMKTWAETE
jgi:uncharacterized protein YutE (UPF0331/DUF86 family)